MYANNPIAAFERALRKRVRLLVAATVAATIVESGFFIFYSTAIYNGLPLWVAVLVGLTLPAGLVGFLVLLREQTRRTVEFVRAVRPRIRDAALFSGTGPVLVFDNGLAFSAFSIAASFWLFGYAGGAVMDPRTAREVQAARRGTYRMRRVVSVGTRRGPTWARDRLRGIQDRVGTKQAFASLIERRGTGTPDSTAAAWAAMAVFSDLRWTRKADRWLHELDTVRDFLLALRREPSLSEQPGG